MASLVHRSNKLGGSRMYLSGQMELAEKICVLNLENKDIRIVYVLDQGWSDTRSLR